MKNWYKFKGTRKEAVPPAQIPEPPLWRKFGDNTEPLDEPPPEPDKQSIRRGETFHAGPRVIEAVNTALYLRRPLLVTGRAGVGKSSLAHAVALELGLGRVLNWPVNTRSTLKEGLYQYDAVGRLQELQMAKIQKDLYGKPLDLKQEEMLKPDMIGKYIRLGPLGTALLPRDRPRVLLIDEIDKSDVDLPNDLLNVFEEGEFEIPELSRIKEIADPVHVMPHDGGTPVPVHQGRVRCRQFPFVVLTSNGERDFPQPFLRRCLRLEIPRPEKDELARIVREHFRDAGDEEWNVRKKLIDIFLDRRNQGELANDQLLNAVFLSTRDIDLVDGGVENDRESLIRLVLRHLDRKDEI